MSKFNTIVLDSSASFSQLCVLGAAHGTDKSPYSFTPPGRHRHGYTAAYDLLFASKRFAPLVLGEIGVLENKSMRMWREYFPLATLIGFDAFTERLEAARADRLYNSRYIYGNVTSESSLSDALNSAGSMFDILIDDSTHLFADQVRIAKVATKYLKFGGIFVIEDVFRGWPEERYAEAVAELSPYYCLQTFLVTDHEHSDVSGEFEPYYDNDKLLVMVRNNVAWESTLDKNVENVARLESLRSSQE